MITVIVSDSNGKHTTITDVCSFISVRQREEVKSDAGEVIIKASEDELIVNSADYKKSDKFPETDWNIISIFKE